MCVYIITFRLSLSASSLHDRMWRGRLFHYLMKYNQVKQPPVGGIFCFRSNKRPGEEQCFSDSLFLCIVFSLSGEMSGRMRKDHTPNSFFFVLLLLLSLRLLAELSKTVFCLYFFSLSLSLFNEDVFFPSRTGKSSLFVFVGFCWNSFPMARIPTDLKEQPFSELFL